MTIEDDEERAKNIAINISQELSNKKVPVAIGIEALMIALCAGIISHELDKEETIACLRLILRDVQIAHNELKDDDD